MAVMATAWAMCLMWPGAADAHKVSVFAWVDGDTVHVQGKFSGGKRVQNSDVVVTDPDGKELLRGKTDDQGEFSFKIPQKTTLTVSLEAGAGHLGSWTIPAEEIAGVAAEDVDAPDAPAAETAERETGGPETGRAVSSELGPEEIERIVEKVMDRKLKPVMRILADEQDKGPSAAEIFGGIGYILGLMGVASYFRFRKTQQAEKSDAD